MIGNACNTNNIHEAITSANPQAQTDIVGYISSGISLQSPHSMKMQTPLHHNFNKFLKGLVPQVQMH